jgi:4-hydroxy-3-methylbut-2-enyl diphosphate reductase
MNRRLTVLLAEPRGFCAGVERAVGMVEAALKEYGPPIYVRHSIVHNPLVVADLTRRGVVFVETLAGVPRGARVLFSAHGVAPSVWQEAAARGLRWLDATCPLVLKVHREVIANTAMGRHTLVVGSPTHVEVLGTSGHAREGLFSIIETVADAENFPIDPDISYAVVTQTTLSIDDTAQILTVLRSRIPSLREPAAEDICYATTNRQAAVKAIAPRCDAMIVIGGVDSSNSRNLVQVARKAGCQSSYLVDLPEDFDLRELDSCTTIGLTSGASTPERAVEVMLRRITIRFSVLVQTVSVAEERVKFRGLPVNRLV